MKNTILITFLFAGLFCKAQQQELFENTWYLVEIEDEAHSGPYSPPVSDEFDPTTLNFFTENATAYFKTGVCAEIEGTISSFVEEDHQFFIGTLSCCGEDSCTEPENEDFENSYSGFFMEGDFVWYNITPNSDGSLTLTLGNAIFVGLTFINQQFSTSETSGLNENNFQLVFQNDQLIIQNAKLIAKSVSIYDLTGKLLLSSEVSSSQKVNTSGLPNGIYVVKILDQNGQVHTRKIRKE